MKALIVAPLFIAAVIVFGSLVRDLRRGVIERGNVRRAESPRRFWLTICVGLAFSLYVCFATGWLAIKLATE